MALPLYPTLTASCGSLAFVCFVPDIAANIIVKPPTLPKNIKNINISFDKLPSPCVIPNERPTVAIAEADSNIQLNIGKPSALLITSDETINRI